MMVAEVGHSYLSAVFSPTESTEYQFDAWAPEVFCHPDNPCGFDTIGLVRFDEVDGLDPDIVLNPLFSDTWIDTTAGNNTFSDIGTLDPGKTYRLTVEVFGDFPGSNDNQSTPMDFQFQLIPEPSTSSIPTLSPAGLLVFAAGLLGFIGYYRRRF